MSMESNGFGYARVLVLEDDYLLATDLQMALETIGATVIGPFGNAREAAEALVEEKPDCAFVDVNLGHGPTFDVPRALAQHAVPFVFVTGYDADAIPQEFTGVARLEKPIETKKVLETVSLLLGRQ
jgi:DNA-binding NtrC family response regulator